MPQRLLTRAFERPVSVVEIRAALLPSEIEKLKTKYPSFGNLHVSSIVKLLCNRRKIKLSASGGRFNYYEVPGILKKRARGVDLFKSRRQRVLELTRQAVGAYGRSLQMGEIAEYAKTLPECKDLSPAIIRHSVASLKQTGEIKMVASIRGDSKGFSLYLPSEFNVDDFIPAEPTTWMDFLLKIFTEIWDRNITEAAKTGRKPFPITTGRLRNEIVKTGKFAEKLGDPKTLVGAIRQLASTENPSVKKIIRPKQKAVFWVPFDVDEHDVSLGNIYAHDTERLEEATTRAMFKFQGRPVTSAEIKSEINSDPDLRLNSRVRCHTLLSDVTRAVIAHGQERKARINERIFRVGKVEGRTFYSTINTPETRAYVTFKSLQEVWRSLDADKQMLDLERLIAPAISFGKIFYLCKNLEHIQSGLRKIKDLEIPSIRIEEIGGLFEHVNDLIVICKNWLKSKEKLFRIELNDKENVPEGLTSQELYELIKPYYHRINVTRSSTIASLVGKVIRRYRNPSFERINLKTPRLAAEFLYDKTDALIYIAKEWGGSESRFQSGLASNNLGLLRDSRFALADLESEDFNVRLAAVACLAFLPSAGNGQILKKVATFDIDAGVRQSALWAYGLIEGKTAKALFQNRLIRDKNSKVRSFIEKLISLDSENWFDV